MALSKNKKQADTKHTDLEKYDIIEIRRDQIKNAPYNPRGITAKARRKLKENIKAVGLLEPIIWNKRTGNIVSGHQRIDCLDQLERTHEYLLRVSAVDLDEKTEKEQNIFMNNPQAQGYFEMELLDGMLSSDEIDIEMAGFDQSDIIDLVDEHMTEKQVAGMAALSNKMHDAVKSFEAAAKTSNDRNDTDFYLVVVFKSSESRADFCSRHGFDDYRYLSGGELDDALSSARLPDSETGPK